MSPEWLKEYLVKEYFEGLQDKIETSERNVLAALKAHEKLEMSHLKRIEKRQGELDSWKNRATVVIGVIAFAVALQLGPTAGAVITAII